MSSEEGEFKFVRGRNYRVGKHQSKSLGREGVVAHSLLISWRECCEDLRNILNWW